MPVAILWEPQISQTKFPSLYSSLIPISLFTQSILWATSGTILIRFTSGNFIALKSISVLSLYLTLASVILLHEKYLKSRVFITYCVCCLLTSLSTTYYYKLIITSLYLLFPISDISCSKTGYLSPQVRYSFECMYTYETQNRSTALCDDTVYQLSTRSVNKYRKYG